MSVLVIVITMMNQDVKIVRLMICVGGRRILLKSIEHNIPSPAIPRFDSVLSHSDKGGYVALTRSPKFALASKLHISPERQAKFDIDWLKKKGLK